MEIIKTSEDALAVLKKTRLQAPAALKTKEMPSLTDTLINIVPKNPIASLMNGNIFEHYVSETVICNGYVNSTNSTSCE